VARLIGLLLFVLTLGESLAAGSPDQLMQDARNYLEKGEVKAAVIQLKNLLQSAPDNADARVLLGEAYLKLGDGASAAKELEKARDLKVPRERWIVSLARAYLLQNQPRMVMERIESDEQLSTSVRAQLEALRGMAGIALDDAEKARERFSAALQLDPDSSEALLGLAMLEARQKQFKQAANYANQALAKDPNNSLAWTMLGETRRLEGDQQGAVDAFSRAIALQPMEMRARIGRATAYIALAKLAEAQNDVDEVRKVAGDLPLALYLHAVIAFQNNKLQEAEDALVRVQNAIPGHPPSQLLLGAIAYQLGKLEAAENNLSKYVTAVPEHLPAAKLLAATRLKMGRAGEAIDLLKKWADKEQSDPQLLAMLGSAYLKNKQYDQGTDYLSRAAELAPNIAAVRAQLGLGRIAAGQMDQAVVDLKSAVDLDPALMQADVMLTLALIQQKKYDEAIAVANKLKSKLADDPMPDNLLGAAYMAKGEADEARKHWRGALAIKPDYATAALNLAKLSLSQNKPDDAIKEYEHVLQRDPKNLPAFLGLAQIAEQRKDYAKMARLLEDARDKNPKAPEPAIMLTRYYLAQGKGLQALDIARETERNNPANPIALQNLGLAQLALDQGANAVASFKKLVGRFPENAEFHHQLAQALFKAGDRRAAIGEWDESLKRVPDFIPALLAKAELALQDKQFGDALKIADGIKVKYPKSPLGFQVEGDVWFAQEQFGKALGAYEKAYQSAPSAFLARRLFQVRHKLGDDPAAFDGMRKWLESAQNDSDSWLMLAMGYQESARLKEAAAAYEKAYELKPENALIQNNLAWIYQELGDKKALSLAEKISIGADSNPEVVDTVGWIFLQNGKEDKGLVLLQQAAVHAPHIVQVRLHLAEALIKTGRKDEARKELERLLREEKDFPEKGRAEALLRGL